MGKLLKMQGKALLLGIVAFCIVSARKESVNTFTRSLDTKSIKNITEFEKSSIISLQEFLLYEKGFQDVKNDNCRRDLNSTLWGIVKGSPWAVSMYDSSVKAPAGVQTGSVYQLGNFDECVDGVDQNFHRRVIPKYCLADVTVEGLTVKSLMTRKPQTLMSYLGSIGYIMGGSGIKEALMTMYVENTITHILSGRAVSNSTVIHWAVCLPSSCLPEDIEIFMSSILDLEVHVDEDKCYVKKPFEATKGMVIYSCIILCFFMMTLFATLYHSYTIFREKPLKEKPNQTFEMVMKSFSIIENMKKLFQKSHDHLGLNAINGMKAISMFLVLLGHSCLFISAGPVMNLDFLSLAAKQVQNGFMFNSVLYVDTFLLLSGFLFCRILLIELERRRGKINVLLLYIFRYIRLTPAYLAVIAFYMTWFPKIGSGPLWKSRVGLEQERCQKSWWLNILYINNYVGNDTLCMFQSWYLSVDTQLYILAPMAIYLLWKSRKIGICFLSLVTVVTSTLPFVITYMENLDPTFLTYIDEIEDISANNYFKNTYIKTHMRATGYVAGLLTGFLVHYIQEKRIEIPLKIVYPMWVVSIILGVGSMFSVTVFYTMPHTTLESALYAGLNRVGWSVSTGWFVIAVVTNNAGFIRTFLTSRFFAPLSRLTYCAYLTNGIVELHQLGSLRTPIYLNYINLFGIPMSHSIYTFLTSVALCLLFESPIHGIEKILLKKDSQRMQNQKRKENPSPSTSEETA